MYITNTLTDQVLFLKQGYITVHVGETVKINDEDANESSVLSAVERGHATVSATLPASVTSADAAVEVPVATITEVGDPIAPVNVADGSITDVTNP